MCADKLANMGLEAGVDMQVYNKPPMEVLPIIRQNIYPYACFVWVSFCLLGQAPFCTLIRILNIIANGFYASLQSQI